MSNDLNAIGTLFTNNDEANRILPGKRVVHHVQQLPSLHDIVGNEHVGSMIEDVYVELVDDVLFGLILQMHRAARLDYLFYLEPDTDPLFDKQFEIFNEADVMGVLTNSNENSKSSNGWYFFFFFNFNFLRRHVFYEMISKILFSQ